jgi:hypothetical protein
LLTEPYFDFIERRNKPWVLVIRARSSDSVNPHLSLPQNGDCILVRRPSDEVKLDNMPRLVKKHLKTAIKILVAEVDRTGDTVRIYPCPIENF